MKFTSRERVEKSLNSLVGVVEGISIDGVINDAELSFLQAWLDDHADAQRRHPFSEVVPVVVDAIRDGVLTAEERANIKWVCGNVCSEEYVGRAAADVQRLHAVLGGIVADGVISESELDGLTEWLDEHQELRKCYPYEEIESLVTTVMQDRKIDEREHKMLKEFFADFIEIRDDKTITHAPVLDGDSVVGLCAVCPEIQFEGAKFCFTGTSSRYSRAEFGSLVEQLGGVVVDSLSAKVTYLIVGADGNPCWMYACYGRKVERAVQLRKEGAQLLIIHENDFHDAVADLG